jgi:hypothetical protein
MYMRERKSQWKKKCCVMEFLSGAILLIGNVGKFIFFFKIPNMFESETHFEVLFKHALQNIHAYSTVGL